MKKSTPSFVISFQLRTTQKHERILFSRLKVGSHIYNQLLRETLKRRSTLVKNKEYQGLINLYRQEKDKDKRKLISKDIKIIQEKLQFTEFSLNNFSAKFTRPFKNTIGSQVAQKLAKRAFNAVSQYHYKKRGKPRFKRIRSLENTTNQCNLRFKNNTLIWGKLKIPAIINHNDPYVQHAFGHKIKFCRVIHKRIFGKNRFFIQLILEGIPLQRFKPGNGTVGIDLGPSTVAIVSEKSALLEELCPDIKDKSKVTKTLQRKLDRQRRANNPGNYNDDRTIKKGPKIWNNSRRYLKTRWKIAEIERKISEHRKSQHGNLANRIFVMGNSFKIENNCYKAWQKMFGRSIKKRAPAMLKDMIVTKASSAGIQSLIFSTFQTFLSQMCICGARVKKPLSQRWHICECGVEAQRDLLAAYLSRFVERYEAEDKISYKLDIDSARESWVDGGAILQQAISNVKQLANSGNHVPRSFGVNWRQSESSVKLLDKKNAATVNNYVTVGESSSFNK